MDDRRDRIEIARSGAVLIGLRDVADLLGVSYGAVRVMRTRGNLPPPDYVVSGTPIWHPDTILESRPVSGPLPPGDPSPDTGRDPT